MRAGARRRRGLSCRRLVANKGDADGSGAGGASETDGDAAATRAQQGRPHFKNGFACNRLSINLHQQVAFLYGV